ncbi:MAG TPA: hypothetical protein VGB70_12710 [Allosphingosinicella sp.]|jgi:hypothetical protein
MLGDPYDSPTPESLQSRMAGAPKAEGPDPGFFGSVALGFRQGGVQEDWGLNQVNHEGRAYEAIRKALEERGHKVPHMNLQIWRGANSGHRALSYPEQRAQAQAFWTALAAERKRDPHFLPEFGDVADYKSLGAHVAAKRREETERLGRQLESGSTIGSFIGQLGHGLTDPTSYIPLGGATKASGLARQILSTAGREAAANAGMTVALEPFVREDAKRLGIERGAGDLLRDAATSAVAGGVIGGGVKAVEIGAGRLGDRRKQAGTAADRDAIGALDAAVPPDLRTPDERAARHVVEREAEVREASPFLSSVAGDDEHHSRLEAALWKATEQPAAAVPRAAPPPAPKVTRSSLLANSADAAKFRMPAREQLKARIRGVESGGNDRAKNPGSSASGRYQFTMDTWLSYYKRRYGKGKASNADIWAKRFDGDLQEVLMNDLLADNAKALRDAGQPETAGSLYLLHFAGEAGGLKILRAAPDTPIERLMTPAAIKANGFLRGKTAADVIAWADGKMGARGETAGVPDGRATDTPDAPLPDLPEIDRGVVPVSFAARADWLDDLDLPILRAELFGTPEEHARAQLAVWRERDAEEGFAELVDDPPEPRPAVTVRDRPAGAPRRSGPADILREIADAGGLLDNEGHDLAAGRGVPKFQLGTGSIIRKDGAAGAKSLDEMGEYLWGRGWFGPPETTPRPRADDVLELVERGVREKVYRPDDAADALDAAARARAPSEEEALAELQETALEMGAELDAETLDDALMRRAGGAAPEDAVAEAVEAARFRDLQPAATLARFDDPDGEAAQALVASLEHDLRMQIEAAVDDRTLPFLAEFERIGVDELIRIRIRDNAPAGFDIGGFLAEQEVSVRQMIAEQRAIPISSLLGQIRHAELDALEARLDRKPEQRRASDAANDPRSHGEAEPARLPVWAFVDEEGEVTLTERLDELNGDLAAVDEMRGCMAPPVREAAE